MPFILHMFYNCLDHVRPVFVIASVCKCPCFVMSVLAHALFFNVSVLKNDHLVKRLSSCTHQQACLYSVTAPFPKGSSLPARSWRLRSWGRIHGIRSSLQRGSTPSWHKFKLQFIRNNNASTVQWPLQPHLQSMLVSTTKQVKRFFEIVRHTEPL